MRDFEFRDKFQPERPKSWELILIWQEKEILYKNNKSILSYVFLVAEIYQLFTDTVKLIKR